jgi:hypothetical protein
VRAVLDGIHLDGSSSVVLRRPTLDDVFLTLTEARAGLPATRLQEAS